MKKLVSLLLVLCMVLSLGAVATAEEKVKITLYRDTFNLGAIDADQIQKVEDAINAYIADKINVEIELVDILNAEYADKANMALANKEVNLLWTASWMGTIGTNDLVPANAVTDITDYLAGTPLSAPWPKASGKLPSTTAATTSSPFTRTTWKAMTSCSPRRRSISSAGICPP